MIAGEMIKKIYLNFTISITEQAFKRIVSKLKTSIIYIQLTELKHKNENIPIARLFCKKNLIKSEYL